MSTELSIEYIHKPNCPNEGSYSNDNGRTWRCRDCHIRVQPPREPN